MKLSITCAGALARKYDDKGRKRIRSAISAWIKADAARGIKTHHVAVDDAAKMKKLGVPAVAGKVTAGKVKRALDALVAKLAPDYVVIIGAGDVVPFFEVANPSLDEDGDDDANVPTDNPYACSKVFKSGKRSSYLVPDRVVGRIPDLPNSNDPSWLIDYLAVASGWKSRPASSYGDDLLICCAEWIGAGEACVDFLARKQNRLLSSPPSEDASQVVRNRHPALLHMIKCHGAPNDSFFYGQKGSKFPDALKSTSLAKRTKPGTVVGAMCCFGASIFDPFDPTAEHPSDVPIPSIYLRQGAYGFFGSTCTAWVGVDSMMCADWVVASALKSMIGGASLGRALLEGKQDFIRWTEQQGDELDAADEKTLIQFALLGDPSVHPVAASTPAGVATAAMLGATPTTAAVSARRQRRVIRQQLGEVLRAGLPERHPARRAVPAKVREVARVLATRSAGGRSVRLRAPTVHRMERPSKPTLFASANGNAVAVAAAGPGGARVVPRRSYQYYWANRTDDGPVPDIRLVSVNTDDKGNLLRARVCVSS